MNVISTFVAVKKTEPKNHKLRLSLTFEGSDRVQQISFREGFRNIFNSIIGRKYQKLCRHILINIVNDGEEGGRRWRGLSWNAGDFETLGSWNFN
jgi:hypothetical protein